MRKFAVKRLVMAAVCCAGVSASHAEVVTYQATGISVGTLLGPGTHAGSFVLSGLGSVEIHSAIFAFSFDDDLDALVGPETTLQTATSGYVYSDGYYSVYYRRTSTQTTTYTSTRDGESAGLTMGDANQAMGTGGTASTTTTTSSTSYVGRTVDNSFYSGGGFCNRCYSTYYEYSTDHYSQVIDNVVESTGAFGISGTISDTNMLNQLLAPSGLGFQLNMAGDAFYSGGSLTINYSVVQADPSGVPEPGTLALLSIALSGLGLANARRRRREAH